MEKIIEWKEYLLSKKKIIILIGGIGLLLLLIILLLIILNKKEPDKVELEDDLVKDITAVEKHDEYVFVDIKGEVNNPGIYEINSNSRVQDVIDIAGGITTKADTTVINLSKKVFDEMIIIIYSKDQVKKYEEVKEIENNKIEACPNITEINNDACIEKNEILTQNESSEKLGDKQLIEIEPLPDQIIDLDENEKNNLVSLNNATLEELMTLPGIGKSKAEKIIIYRKENGSFKSIDDLKNVSGIGDSTFEKLKQYLTL